eukprot:TRINITY_DN22389_c0_g1_i1.p1 TRINITY_DN22389_c0_g1~~TRINITY_DN22389_c0_g1_i1.p1  ORF type:complete len:501 (+),score=96.89 TRINITY_DN22389_c0_g1_i1:2575-4077(+)
MNRVVRAQSYVRRWIVKHRYATYDIKKLHARNKVFKDLMQSEYQYYESLKILQHEFFEPLNERSSGGKSLILTKEEIDSVFGNASKITECEKLIITVLEDAYNNDWPLLNLGSTLLKIVKLLQEDDLYIEYATGFNHARNNYMHLKEKNKKFEHFLRQAASKMREKDEQQVLDFRGLLSLPFNRINSHLNYIKRLAELSSPGNEDYNNVIRAREQIANLITFVHDCLGRSPNIAKIREIHSLLVGALKPPLLLAPGRQYLTEGPLREVDISTGKMQKRYMYMFTDILIATRPLENKQKQARVLHIYNLKESKVFDLKDRPALRNSFKFKVRKDIFRFATKTAEEKERWLEVLMQRTGHAPQSASGFSQFYGLIKNRRGFVAFKKFLGEQMKTGLRLLTFWDAVQKFKNSPLNEGIEEISMDIYKSYIEPASVQEIPLASSIRRQLQAVFEQRCGEITRNTFDAAQKDALDKLEKDYQEKFAKSAIYIKLKQDLKENQIEI